MALYWGLIESLPLPFGPYGILQASIWAPKNQNIKLKISFTKIYGSLWGPYGKPSFAIWPIWYPIGFHMAPQSSTRYDPKWNRHVQKRNLYVHRFHRYVPWGSIYVHKRNLYVHRFNSYVPWGSIYVHKRDLYVQGQASILITKHSFRVQGFLDKAYIFTWGWDI